MQDRNVPSTSSDTAGGVPEVAVYYPPQQPPIQQPNMRGWWIAVAITAVVVAVTVTLAVALTGGKDRAVDESAWRDAREAQGAQFVNWRQYADTWLNKVCTDEDFDLFLAMQLDDGVSEESMRTDFTYACPDRLGEFEQFLIEMDEPCAGMSAEDRRYFEEAMGNGYQC